MLGTYSHRFPDFHLVGVGLFAELDASGFVIVLFSERKEGLVLCFRVVCCVVLSGMFSMNIL